MKRLRTSLTIDARPAAIEMAPPTREHDRTFPQESEHTAGEGQGRLDLKEPDLHVLQPTAEMLRREGKEGWMRRALLERRRPDFLLVGAPKSGTTAMHAYLQWHPEVFMPAAKEIHYYGSDLSGLLTQLSPEQHQAMFAGSESARRAGETCIWALYSHKAAEEIKREIPNARILIMLRDPVNMIYAQHAELVYQGIEDITSFRRALAAEEDRKHGRRLPKNTTPVPSPILFYRDVVRYAEQVERYFRAFGPKQVHVILYDDLKRDSHGVYRKVLEFLDVDPDFQTDLPVINPNKRVRSIRLRKLLHQPPPLLNRLCRTMIPSTATRKSLLDSLDRWNVGFHPRPPMNEKLRRQLQEEFAPDVERLSTLLGRDLTHWVREPNAPAPSQTPERRAA